MDDAIAAREIINNCYEQAMQGLELSIEEGNARRKEYWLERVIHLMGEMNAIDRTIKELEAATDSESVNRL